MPDSACRLRGRLPASRDAAPIVILITQHENVKYMGNPIRVRVPGKLVRDADGGGLGVGAGVHRLRASR